MGFWPFKRKQPAMRPVEVSSPNDPLPEHLQTAFNDAAKHPLEDMVYRLVIASRQWHIIADVGVLSMSTTLDAYESMKRGDLSQSRIAAAQLLAEMFDKSKRPEGEAIKVVRFAAFAFFDRAFTVGSNKGKTHENAWNTLVLEIESLPDKVRVARRAVRIEYPEGVVSLDFDDMMKGLFSPFR